MNDRAKLNDVAPKDVKQLEVLKPINTPSMSARFKKSIEKEKRLEVASRPIQKTSDQSKKKEDEADDEPIVGRNKRKRNKKKTKAEEKKKSVAKMDEGALDQEDEVEEGINWSDDEE